MSALNNDQYVPVLNKRQNDSQIANIAMVSAAAGFVILRFIARKTRGMGLKLDDWMEVVSLILLMGLLATAISTIHYGSGLHRNTLSYSEIVGFSKVMVAFECIYQTTILAIKSSLLLMYNRMFPVRQIRNASLLLWILSAFLTFSVILVSIFQCTPTQKTWTPGLPGHCMNLKSSLIFTSLPNVLTDFAILVLPIRLVWNMEIRVNQKYILTLVFLSGCIFITASIYRFAVLFEYEEADFTYTILDPITWTVVECSAGIITACIPTLIPLLKPISVFMVTLFASKDVTEIVGQSDSIEHVISDNSQFSHISIKRSKTLKKGRRPFHRLSSTFSRTDNDGRMTPGGTALPLEIRVEKTFEIITTILSNDGPIPVTPIQEEEARDIEMIGFRHNYGPKRMSGWL